MGKSLTTQYRSTTTEQWWVETALLFLYTPDGLDGSGGAARGAGGDAAGAVGRSHVV